MFGAGYIEMLARQMTADLQAIRNGSTRAGRRGHPDRQGYPLRHPRRAADGSWITSGVEGLPASSLATSGPTEPPSLIIRPFHQAGNVVSIREFTNNAFNHHHGIQSTERFGPGTDPDGDGFKNEMTRADITAVTVFQATLPPPGRVIPRFRPSSRRWSAASSSSSPLAAAPATSRPPPLDGQGRLFSEPNPYNPPGNLQP